MRRCQPNQKGQPNQGRPNPGLHCVAPSESVSHHLPLVPRRRDALLAAWLPGTEADGLADVLFGTQPASGRLSFSWPRSMQQARCAQRQPSAGHRENIPLYPLGFGLDLAGIPLVRRDPSGAA